MKETLTEFELAKITLSSLLSMAVYSKICPNNILCEFLFLAIPQYFTIVFLKQAHYLYIVFIIALILLSNRKIVIAEKKIDRLTNGIDKSRYVIISCVAIAIFAADFSFYDINSHKLGKSMDYGLMLMDIGVGSFVFNAGFFSVKASPRRKVRSICQSLLLGSIRLVSKFYCRLDVDDKEFGTHLNFFFILAVLNVLSFWIQSDFDFAIGMGMCVLHEILLNFAGLKDLIYSTTRSNIVLANIEGLSFILPQMGMFLIAGAFSKAVFSTKPSKHALAYYLVSLAAFLVSRSYSLSNRRIHNLTFCMIIILLHTTIGFLSLVMDRFTSSVTCRIQRFGSRHMLFTFLWANFLVFVNKSFIRSQGAPNFFNHALCIGYLALVFLLPFMASRVWSELFLDREKLRNK